MSIYFEDDNTASSTYRVEMSFGIKGRSFSGLSGNPIVLTGLNPGIYSGIVLTREEDQCQSDSYIREHEVEFGCDFEAMRGRNCSSGTTSATSCIDGSLVTHPSTDLTPNTYTALHDGWAPNCIIEVDGSCNFVEPSELGFCLDYDKAAPTHFIIYTPENGIQNTGLTDLEAATYCLDTL